MATRKKASTQRAPAKKKAPVKKATPATKKKNPVVAGLEGGTWRSIDLYEGDILDEKAFKALLKEAMAYNDAHRVPKSRGSNV